MRFPPYWAKGTSGDCSCWRWSFQSLADAQTGAALAAQQLAARFGAEGFPKKEHGYYADRPLREEVLREIKDSTGTLAAVVTRNSYGCQVLNTARVMFVDIDFPEAKPAGGFLKKLFGGSAKADHQADALALVENWTRQNPGWGWRIYRTKAGMRLLATHALVEADSPEAEAVFEALGSDPLYRKLCKVQKCFRARLTPKPWRCGVNHKPPRWPWADAKAEKWFQTWNKQYESFAFNWGTCQFLRAIGCPAVHPEIQPLVQLHDEATRATINSNLA